MLTVPQRFEHRVGKAGIDDILDWLFAKVMVDPEYVLLGKVLLQQSVQCARSFAVMAKRLLDHQTSVVSATRLRECLRHGRKQAWGHREIVQRPLRLAKLFAQLGEGRSVVIVAIDIAQQRHQPLHRLRICTAMVLQAVCRARLQLVEIPPGLGDADDWDIQPLITYQTQ